MPLPTDPKQAWPPTGWKPLQRDLTEADAWYSGDTTRLETFYGGTSTSTAATRQNWWQRFWARRSQDVTSTRQRIHVPAAADIAATSADLLFGETPRLVIPEAHQEIADSDEQQSDVTAAVAAAQACEDRLAELLEYDAGAGLLEAADVCSGLGGVYLRTTWDTDLCPHPFLTVVHADRAVPDFRWGHLTAVTFWRQLESTDREVWRHLERYEPGTILHGLYKGTSTTLGTRVPLASHPATAALDVDDDGAVRNIPQALIDGKRLLVSYVPNALPNRRHRDKPVGRADTAGCEDLMDGLDETFTSWMREIRLVKPRIVVPAQFLQTVGGRGGGKAFDVDAEIFSPLEMDPAAVENAGITIADFTLHTEQYAATCRDIFEKIVTTAGYSPQTFGLQGDGAEQTATEVDAREGRSERTTAKKRRYWARAIEDQGEVLLHVDAAMTQSGVTPMRPRVVWGELGGTSIREVASSLNLLNLAEAISTEAKVRMLHPDWDDPDVRAEVDAILREKGIAVADPTGGAPRPTLMR